jgi:hypothetical protein
VLAERYLRLPAGVRLVTLTGPGGIGKTRPGRRAAANLLNDIVDGLPLAIELAAARVRLLPPEAAWPHPWSGRRRGWRVWSTALPTHCPGPCSIGPGWGTRRPAISDENAQPMTRHPCPPGAFRQSGVVVNPAPR